MNKKIEMTVSQVATKETSKGNFFILNCKSLQGKSPEVTLTIKDTDSASLDGFPRGHQFSMQINNPQKNMKDFQDSETGKDEPL